MLVMMVVKHQQVPLLVDICKIYCMVVQKLLENEQTSAKTLERQLTQEREALQQVRDAAHGKVDSSQLQDALVKATSMQQARTGQSCFETHECCLPWQPASALTAHSRNIFIGISPGYKRLLEISVLTLPSKLQMCRSQRSNVTSLLHCITLCTRADLEHPSARKDALDTQAYPKT